MKNFAALLFVSGMLFLVTFAGISPNSNLNINSRKTQLIHSDDSMSNTHRQYAKYLPGKIIVKFKPEKLSLHKQMTVQSFSNQPSLMKTMESLGINDVKKVFPSEVSPSNLKKVDLSSIYELSFAESRDPWILAAKLSENENVIYAEPYFIYEPVSTPNDSLFKDQYHLKLIQAAKAWDITQGSKDIVIAVVDNGVDWWHPDLVENIWQNLGEDSDGDGRTIEFNGSYWVLDPGDLNGIDDDDFDGDPTTFVDDLIGWDVANNDNGLTHNNYHGTFVAGVASATTNNGIGVAGVGFNCKILPIKSASDGQEYIDFGFTGIKYAVDAGADVINLSWGGGGFSSFGFDIINYAYENGVVIVASAGNYDDDSRFYPAAYPHVLSVAATTDYDSKASFSNYGHWIDLSAPGVSILSLDSNGKYRTSSGTSFASPIVAGVAGLVKSQHLDWSADIISEQIRTSSDKIELADLKNTPELGYGRVNAYNALTKSSPSIRVVDINISDRLGDNDGIPERGEDIELTVTLKNFLQSVENIQVVLDEDDVNITMINDEAYFSIIQGTQVVDNHENPFKFHIGHVTPMGRLVEFLLKIQANEYYDWEPIYIRVAPLHSDHDAGNVVLTITSIGAIGYYEYVKDDALIGNGFRFPKENGSALFHGSFIVASDKYHVSDNSYGDDYHAAWDWETEADGDLNIQTDQLGNQVGFARFIDRIAENPIGISVTQNSYAYGNPPYDDFVIMEYIVKNVSGEFLPYIYAGIFLDWDIGNSADDQVGYESQLNLGYFFDNLPNVSNFYGLALLSPKVAASYRAIKNPDYIFPGFVDSTKFQFMTEGMKVITSDEPNDWSHLLSAGPFNLQPNETVQIAYAILGGENLEDLQNNTKYAQQIYGASKSLSGAVNYYSENRGISKTKVILKNTDSTFTNDSGGYYFVNPTQGNIDMYVTKEGYIGNAISGADVLMIMQHLAYSRRLVGGTLIAADVTNDDLVSGSDVIALQRYLAFYSNNTGSAGQWFFSPSDTSFNFENEAIVNFTGYLLGDCTADWGIIQNQLMVDDDMKNDQNLEQNPGILEKPAIIKATLKLPENVSGDPGTNIDVPILVTTDSTIGFSQFVVEFDSTIIALDTVFIGSDVPNFIITQITTNLPFMPTGDGTNKNILVQISGGGTHTFAGDQQEVVILNFQIVNGPGEQSPLIFDKNADRTFLTTSNLSDIVEDEIEFIDGMAIVTPVELIKFEGYTNGNQVELVWITASETNNFGFEIERSSGGYSFKKLSFIEGHSTIQVNQQYSYIDREVEPGIYDYRLKQIDTNGKFCYIGEIQIEVSVPLEYKLEQNYPNPFNPTTTISYQIKEKSKVEIVIFDLLGRKLKTLVNETKNAGMFNITWEGKDLSGNNVAAGIYMYKIYVKNVITGEKFIHSRKMVLIR